MSDPLVRRDLTAEARAVPDAREAVEVLRDRLPPDTFNDLRLMVSELVTNSLRHAGLQPSDRITLTAISEGAVLRVEVRNPGGGFTPPVRDGSADPRGWGLFIVAQLATAWGVVADGATCVWFELALDSRKTSLA